MPRHELDEYDEQPIGIRITHVPRDDPRRPAERCAEMVLRSHRACSKGLKKAYLDAALAFALAGEQGK